MSSLDFTHEQDYWDNGLLVVGVDEVALGRGDDEPRDGEVDGDVLDGRDGHRAGDVDPPHLDVVDALLHLEGEVPREAAVGPVPHLPVRGDLHVVEARAHVHSYAEQHHRREVLGMVA